MWRRGQSTLEYVFLVAIMAVAIIAMLVYIKRGFQGNLRSQSDQIGAGNYSPGNINAYNTEDKNLKSDIVSNSISTITYGNTHKLPDDIIDLKNKAKVIQDAINKLAKQIEALPPGPAQDALITELGKENDKMKEITKQLNPALRAWQLGIAPYAAKTPDKSTSTSTNNETGTEDTTRNTNENLGVLSGDKWQ